MGCCGCSDDLTTKIQPSTPESEGNSGESQAVIATDRSCTDILPLIIFIVLICGFGFFITTSFKKGDIDRVIRGYDDCANICGRINTKDPAIQCKGLDRTKEPYLRISADGSRECVKDCGSKSSYIRILNRCLPKPLDAGTNSIINSSSLRTFYNEVSSDLTVVWPKIIYLLLIALAISLGILISFRYLVQYVIYIVLTATVVVCIAGTIFLWKLWYDEKKGVASGQILKDDASVSSYFVYAIIMSIVAAIVILIILVMRKRIALVIQLFKEAGKAVLAMPSILLQPIYTYLLLTFTVLLWGYFFLLIESAGDLRKINDRRYRYEKDAILGIARWYNLFLFYVMCEFYFGCQHMVIAGGVSQWFFTRDKRKVSLPVLRSTGWLMRYHLGTVAFGSMIIGLVRLIRSILSTIQNRLKHFDNQCVRGLLWCCQCCLWCFECALKFLSRNAYIETAIYGCSFCRGGKKAFQVLANNILRVGAINSVGDFVLFLGKVLVVALTVTAGIYLIQKDGLNHPWVPITLAGLFAFLVAHCFISVYEMVIDTIFICFCEDCAKNDGLSRPYFMSKGLMEFVENSKKALEQLELRQSQASAR